MTRLPLVTIRLSNQTKLFKVTTTYGLLGDFLGWGSHGFMGRLFATLTPTHDLPYPLLAWVTPTHAIPYIALRQSQ